MARNNLEDNRPLESPPDVLLYATVVASLEALGLKHDGDPVVSTGGWVEVRVNGMHTMLIATGGTIAWHSEYAQCSLQANSWRRPAWRSTNSSTWWPCRLGTFQWMTWLSWPLASAPP